LINQITTGHAPQTGLTLDFVIGSLARPAAPNFLEVKTDDDYSWNSVSLRHARYGAPDAPMPTPL